jgi:replicative DNA helicase
MSPTELPDWPPSDDELRLGRATLLQRCLDAETQLLAKAMQSHVSANDLDVKAAPLPIDPSEMVEPLTGQILRAINALRAEGQWATVTAVRNRLATVNEALDEMGGSEFIARLQRAGLYMIGPEAAFVATWRRARDQLALWDVTAEMQDDLMAGDRGSAGEIIDSLTPKLSSIRASRSFEPSTLAGLARRISIRVAAQRNEPTISSGLPKFDEALGGGFIGGLLYGFLARKKVGKTLWMSTIALNMAMRGVPVCYYCFEMGEERISERMIAAHYGGTLNAMQLLKGYGNQRLSAELKAYAADYAPQALYFVDSARPGHAWVQATAEEMHRRYGVKVHFFDYLQLIRGNDRRASKVDQLDEIADWMAEFAKQTGDVVVTSAQLNRNDEMRYGDSLVMAASMVFKINAVDVEFDSVKRKEYWLENTDSRITEGRNAGSEDDRPFALNKTGPRISQLGTEDDTIFPPGARGRLAGDY